MDSSHRTLNTDTPEPNTLDDARREIRRIRAQLSDAQQALATTRKDLDAIRHSRIWRSTLLVRAPVMWMLGLRQGWRLQPGEVAHREGWYPQLCEWWRELRANGWGYFKRLATYERNTGPGSGAHDRNDYDAWKNRFGTCHPGALPKAPEEQLNVLLSVVVPVYRPHLDLLRQAIESVQAQTYPHWELCIADDASGDSALRHYLEQLASNHTNINVVFREINGHISACTNSALSLAKGEFIVLLDQDDLLPAHALERVAQTIAQHPEAGIIFSDEDRIDETGTKALGAYFKPDFNYDLFLGHNLISHLGVYRRSLIEEIDGFKLGLEGSQDWDLALRALERLRPDQIVHIPEVLYHWRAIEGSTALAQSEKSYTSTSSRQAIRDHLERIRVAGEVLPATYLPQFNRVKYELEPELRSAAVLITFDYPVHQLRTMIEGLFQKRGEFQCNFIVVTTQPLAVKDLVWPDQRDAIEVRVVQVPVGTSPAERANAAIGMSTGHFICLVNAPLDDVAENWLEDLARIAGQKRVGFVAPRVIYSAGHVEVLDHGGLLFADKLRATYAHKGLLTSMPGYAGRGLLQQSFMALSPFLLLARREILGRGSEPFTTAFGGDVDLIDKCLELHQSGLCNIWTPDVEVRFKNPNFAGKTNVLVELLPLTSRRKAWIHKWGAQMRDSAYNPNLSPDGDFALNWRNSS